jgi:hypothetical protein
MQQTHYPYFGLFFVTIRKNPSKLDLSTDHNFKTLLIERVIISLFSTNFGKLSSSFYLTKKGRKYGSKGLKRNSKYSRNVQLLYESLDQTSGLFQDTIAAVFQHCSWFG